MANLFKSGKPPHTFVTPPMEDVRECLETGKTKGRETGQSDLESRTLTEKLRDLTATYFRAVFLQVLDAEIVPDKRVGPDDPYRIDRIVYRLRHHDFGLLVDITDEVYRAKIRGPENRQRMYLLDKEITLTYEEVVDANKRYYLELTDSAADKFARVAVNSLVNVILKEVVPNEVPLFAGLTGVSK